MLTVLCNDWHPLLAVQVFYPVIYRFMLSLLRGIYVQWVHKLNWISTFFREATVINISEMFYKRPLYSVLSVKLSNIKVNYYVQTIQFFSFQQLILNENWMPERKKKPFNFKIGDIAWEYFNYRPNILTAIRVVFDSQWGQKKKQIMDDNLSYCNFARDKISSKSKDYALFRQRWTPKR